jgi:hypothetical protein
MESFLTRHGSTYTVTDSMLIAKDQHGRLSQVPLALIIRVEPWRKGFFSKVYCLNIRTQRDSLEFDPEFSTAEERDLLQDCLEEALFRYPG